MAIKGLTDRGMAFPEIGHIRKGAPKQKGKFPRDLDYFRVEFAEGETLAPQKFKETYGARPKAIRIILPFDEIDKTWEAWLEAYTAGRMIGRSDGEYVHYLRGDNDEVLVMSGRGQDGERVPHPVDNIAGHDYKGNPVEYQAVGRLRVIIPELERAAYLVVHTGSKHDISNISDQLRAFKQLNHGRIAGIPLILRRRPVKISVPIDGKRQRVTKSLISIEADPEWVQAKLAEINHSALPNGGAELLLPAEATEQAPVTVEAESDEPDWFEDIEEAPYSGLVEQSAPTTTNRPHSPEALKARLNKDLGDAYYASDMLASIRKPRQVFAAQLNTLFGSDTARYEWCAGMFGASGSSDIPDHCIYNTLEWLDVHGFNEPPVEAAIKEAQASMKWVKGEMGQQEMNLEGGE